jgi:competence protein ComFB
MTKSKKEIDKDLMYKKLMPSGPRSAKNAKAEEESASVYAQIVQDEDPNQRRTIMRREVGVPFMDTQPTILVNAMESIVLEKLDYVLSKCQCCKCDRCKKDIVAKSLNKLPPKYMVLTEGQPTPDIDHQTKAQVISSMIQAVLAVRAKPRH